MLVSVMLVMAVTICIWTIWFIISLVSMLSSRVWLWSCTIISLRKSVMSSSVLPGRLVLFWAQLPAPVALFKLDTSIANSFAILCRSFPFRSRPRRG